MRSVAIVTGGAGGMGLATAKILGSDHTVVISDVKQDALDAAAAELAAAGLTVQTHTADITDRTSVDALFAGAATFGPVASVVHAAGVSPQMGGPGPDREDQRPRDDSCHRGGTRLGE
jgi:NAD(P)-dependent dehydrogenase (short-subunit alcohol dehydrogenase family)